MGAPTAGGVPRGNGPGPVGSAHCWCVRTKSTAAQMGRAGWELVSVPHLCRVSLFFSSDASAYGRDGLPSVRQCPRIYTTRVSAFFVCSSSPCGGCVTRPLQYSTHATTLSSPSSLLQNSPLSRLVTSSHTALLRLRMSRGAPTVTIPYPATAGITHGSALASVTLVVYPRYPHMPLAGTVMVGVAAYAPAVTADLTCPAAVTARKWEPCAVDQRPVRTQTAMHSAFAWKWWWDWGSRCSWESRKRTRARMSGTGSSTGGPGGWAGERRKYLPTPVSCA
mmetsp:Transcript_44296/g.86934  ORF Transcript_44296/g.86934 Transcript_44296/m.86934 type:complete len:279 (+) Transcript_44296:185-1021(+)